MKSAAILLDGGFVLKRLYKMLGRKHPTAQDVYKFAKRCLDETREELFRIYYYDCPPFEREGTNPLDPDKKIDFSATGPAVRKRRVQQELALMDSVAYRKGELRLCGWQLRYNSQRELIDTPRELSPKDFQPDFSQKRVDMMIGLDVAWMASKRIVDRLILVTADTDFIPAMKFARREGVQIILVSMGGVSLRSDMREHADLVRDVQLQEDVG